MTGPRRFDERVVIVTGGGGGIGEATSARFAAEGARIAVVDIDADAADRTAAGIRAAGAVAESHRVDVSVEDDVAALMSSVVERWGTIDVLHNNAAILHSGLADGDIADVAVDAWDAKIAVNLRGAMLCCKYAVPVMRAANHGSIVNTASVSGLLATTTNAAYGASKAALVHLTRSVAAMVGPDGIRCNAVAPGLVLTDRLRQLLSEEQVAMYAAERLLPWAATPDDIAATVTWLASDEARSITGQTIVVDCGVTARRPRDAIDAWLRSSS